MRRRRQAAPQEDEAQARKALERATAMLRQYVRSGLTMVSIEDVLTLLGAEPDSAPVPEEPPRDPRADPLTGCLPVTPRPGLLPQVRGHTPRTEGDVKWLLTAWQLARDIALTGTGLALIISQVGAHDPSSTLIVAGLALTVPAAASHAVTVLSGPSAPGHGQSSSSPPALPPLSSPASLPAEVPGERQGEQGG